MSKFTVNFGTMGQDEDPDAYDRMRDGMLERGGHVTDDGEYDADELAYARWVRRKIAEREQDV